MLKSEDIISIGISISLLYLSISTNYIGELFNNKLREFLNNNIYIKHLLGYLTLVLGIILTNSSNNLIYDLKKSIIIYILFLMSAKNEPFYFMYMMLFLFMSFIINKYNEVYIKDEKEKEKYNNIVLIFIKLGIIILTLGFLKSYKIKLKKYGKSFKIYKFLFYKNINKNL